MDVLDTAIGTWDQHFLKAMDQSANVDNLAADCIAVDNSSGNSSFSTLLMSVNCGAGFINSASIFWKDSRFNRDS